MAAVVVEATAASAGDAAAADRQRRPVPGPSATGSSNIDRRDSEGGGQATPLAVFVFRAVFQGPIVGTDIVGPRGKRALTASPPPGRGSAETVPWSDSTSRATIHMPRPVER